MKRVVDERSIERKMPDRSIRPSSAGGSQRRKQARPPWRSPTMIHPHATSSSASDELEAALRLEHAAAAIAKEVNKIRRRTKVAIAYACRGQCAPFSSRCWECCGLIIAPCSHLAKISMFGKETAQEQALPSAVYNNPKRTFCFFFFGGGGVQGL